MTVRGRESSADRVLLFDRSSHAFLSRIFIEPIRAVQAAGSEE